MPLLRRGILELLKAIGSVGTGLSFRFTCLKTSQIMKGFAPGSVYPWYRDPSMIASLCRLKRAITCASLKRLAKSMIRKRGCISTILVWFSTSHGSEFFELVSFGQMSFSGSAGGRSGVGPVSAGGAASGVVPPVFPAAAPSRGTLPPVPPTVPPVPPAGPPPVPPGPAGPSPPVIPGAFGRADG